MAVAKLRKIGGSTMVAIPPALLEQLELGPEQQIELIVEGEQIVMRRRKRPKYKLADLLAQCDYTIPMSAEEREWLDMPSVGREIVD